MIFSFIKPGGVQQVNVSYDVRNTIYQNIMAQNIQPNLFNEAQNQILGSLKFHSLPMFSQYQREHKGYSVDVEMEVSL